LGRDKVYGIIGKIVARPGKRDALVEILLDGIAAMPGCLSYVVANDQADEDALWVTEVWEAEASHKASLTLPSVQRAISAGRPLIARFGERVVTAPVGGQGLEAGPDRQ
jgi:quinol monooxygenase YgiN